MARAGALDARSPRGALGALPEELVGAHLEARIAQHVVVDAVAGRAI